MPILELKELLWEITSKCNKNCDYCGSKGTINKDVVELSDNQIEKICNDIIEYKIPSVTLTGGEPTISKYFGYIVDKLSKNNIKVNVVTNGTIFTNGIYSDFIKKINQIGLSINDEEDIKDYGMKHADNITRDYSKQHSAQKYYNKITMITNFGTHNIFQFKDLLNIFKKYAFSVWQIQLTMGKYQLNKEGIQYLRKLIHEIEHISFDGNAVYQLTGQQIVLSDNLQYKHTCMAGIATCAITSDGHVVPCLSERTWNDTLRIEGSLLPFSLKEIWETKFQEQRFGCSKCCRDCINFPDEKVPDDERNPTVGGCAIIPFDKKQQPYVVYYGTTEPITYIYGTTEPFNPIKLVYGVTQPQVTSYAVTEPIVMMYTVWTNKLTTDGNTSQPDFYTTDSTGDNLSIDKNGNKTYNYKYIPVDKCPKCGQKNTIGGFSEKCKQVICSTCLLKEGF
jgi:MoaA/NifB/PqqE/SkfB family radical SAM enzyme